MTWISRRPCSSSHRNISSRCALSATSRAAMCGTTRKPRCSSLSLNSRVLSMPFVGEQVTATFASLGRWSACSSAPIVGKSSNLGRDSISESVIGKRPEPLVRPRGPHFQIRLDGLLSRVYERLLDDGGLVLAGLHPHGQPRPQIGKLDRHQGVPDVLPQARRPERRGDLPDLREVVGLAGLEHHIPELHAVAAGVSEVDLEPHLTGVAGPRDHDVHAVEVVLVHPVVLEVEDLLSEDVHHEVPRPGALDLDRGDVGLPDLHCLTEHLLRSRGVSMLVNSKASGPMISTCRSAATSHIVTSLTSFQYSTSMSS